MQIIRFVTLVFSIFAINSVAIAQDTISEQPESKQETIFSRASDTQLKESQRFYKKCSANQTMNKRKDCKCAATSYLETRMRLGADATISQIMEENKNTCLKDKKDETDAQSDLSDVTDAQLKEANEVFEYCDGNAKFSKNFDCECFAARFLDERLKAGPITARDSLFVNIKNECRNVVATTGYEYTRCMEKTKSRPPRNIEPKDYCECYAKKWGKLFESYVGEINIHSKKRIKAQARAICRMPTSYKN